MRIITSVTPSDVNSLMEFYPSGRIDKGTFDDGIEAVLQRCWWIPKFVYRLEPEPAALAAGKPYRITDRAGLPVVFFPVEQRSRRPTCWTSPHKAN